MLVTARLVGTSGDDAVVTLTATENVQVNAYEGDDAVTLNGAATSGSVGMGGGKDTVVQRLLSVK